MKQLGALMMVVVVAALAVSPVQARSKVNRVDEALEEMNRLTELKKTLAENEKFSNQHPAEAKICFDSMMTVADDYGVARQVYFSDNQTYYRECIESQLAAQ